MLQTIHVVLGDGTSLADGLGIEDVRVCRFCDVLGSGLSGTAHTIAT
jgi:hypothetical protein